MNARNVSMVIACIGAAVGLSGCGPNATSSTSVVRETLPPISRAYVVESSEVIEISQFEDGSVKYTPTGWIVVSPSTSKTATAAALRH